MDLPKCPKCGGEYVYEDGSMLICPECSYEWNQAVLADAAVRDINGNILKSGDSVVVVKDLKVKGASGSIKIGTKVKKIKLLDDLVDGHDIECKIDGFGEMYLKSSIVKKA